MKVLQPSLLSMSEHELENKLEITEIKGELKLLNKEIESLKLNHISHLQKSIDNINKVLWTVGVMVLAQFLWVIKTALMG